MGAGLASAWLIGFAAHIVWWAVTLPPDFTGEGKLAAAAFCLVAGSVAIAGVAGLVAAGARGVATDKAIASNTIVAIAIVLAAAAASYHFSSAERNDEIRWIWSGALEIALPCAVNVLLLRLLRGRQAA